MASMARRPGWRARHWGPIPGAPARQAHRCIGTFRPLVLGLVLALATLPAAAGQVAPGDGPAAPTPVTDTPGTTDAAVTPALVHLPTTAPAADRLAYPHADFRAEALGRGARAYWLFEPIEPTPAHAPVVVFNHGWLAVNPGVYGAWIEHLTRRGCVVIYPRYQADWTTRPEEFLGNATAAVRDALDVLSTAPGRVRPIPGRFAYVGHSNGGNLSALMAASADALDLPRAAAVVAIMPGEVVHLTDPDPSRLPADTLLVVVAGDQDRVVGDARAREIFELASRAVPPERRLYLLYRTDRRGPVPMVADHFAPTAALRRLDTGEGPIRQMQFGNAAVDLLDRFGFWRLTDLTLDAAFDGQTLAQIHLGDRLRDLGHWSNGQVVTPPVIATHVADVPRLFPTHGARLIPWQPTDLFRRPPAEPATATATAARDEPAVRKR